MNRDLHKAISALPELYQPLYGVDMDVGRAPQRPCTDRLAQIAKVVSAHPSGAAKVLDIGCAQGYMSLGIADKVPGSSVHGIDYLTENTDICKLLALNNGSSTTFSCESITEIVFKENLENGYQVVLLLNVLHHLCTHLGWEETRKILILAAEKVDFVLVELSSKKEQLEWVRNLPSDDDWLSGFHFVVKLGEFPTHVSGEKRALYFCSNRYVLIDGNAYEFSSCMKRSHAGALGDDVLGRRYYLSPTLIAKRFDFSGEFGRLNKVELSRELCHLRRGMLPKLLAAEMNGAVGLVARERIAGSILVDAWQGRGEIAIRGIFCKILTKLIELEKNGLYHHDLRPWNVLVTPGGDVELIDFGSIRSRKVRFCFEDALALLSWLYTGKWAEGLTAELGQAYCTHFAVFGYLHRTSSSDLSFSEMLMWMTPTVPFSHVPELISCHGDDLASWRTRAQKAARQAIMLTEWATGADAHGKSLSEAQVQLRAAYQAERTARTTEQDEAHKQIAALTEWAAGAETYGQSLMEALDQLRVTYEAERAARASEQTEARKQISALTQWATSAEAYGQSLLETLEPLRVAYGAERAARATEQAEAHTQISALTEWATSSEAYGRSLLEALEPLRVAYGAERAARMTEQTEAHKQISALTEWATSAEAYGQSIAQELKELRVEACKQIAVLDHELTKYKCHWVFRALSALKAVKSKATMIFRSDDARNKTN